MYYVTMTDRFMSGWGRAENRINKFVVECDTMTQAEQVQRAGQQRSEMRYVNICIKKPSYSSKRYLTSFRHYNELSGSWVA